MSLRGHTIELSELVALRAYARGLAFRHRVKASATLGGPYHSRFRGRGMDFNEVRLYQPGDDCRNMDWRVTARRDVPHTKVYTEERELPIYLVVDFRSTMYFGTRVAFKSVVAAKIAALLSWIAIESGDRVGALFMTADGPVILPPQARQNGALLILKHLAELSCQQPKDYESSPQPLLDAVTRLQHMARPNGLVFMISDFQGITPSDLPMLLAIAHKQQLTSIFVYDALEEALPMSGQYTFAHNEKRLSMTTSPELANQYHKQFDSKVTDWRNWHHQHNAQWITLRTDENVVNKLRRELL